jgi:hypothetical protein
LAHSLLNAPNGLFQFQRSSHNVVHLLLSCTLARLSAERGESAVLFFVFGNRKLKKLVGNQAPQGKAATGLMVRGPREEKNKGCKGTGGFKRAKQVEPLSKKDARGRDGKHVRQTQAEEEINAEVPACSGKEEEARMGMQQVGGAGGAMFNFLSGASLNLKSQEGKDEKRGVRSSDWSRVEEDGEGDIPNPSVTGIQEKTRRATSTNESLISQELHQKELESDEKDMGGGVPKSPSMPTLRQKRRSVLVGTSDISAFDVFTSEEEEEEEEDNKANRCLRVSPSTAARNKRLGCGWNAESGTAEEDAREAPRRAQRALDKQLGAAVRRSSVSTHFYNNAQRHILETHFEIEPFVSKQIAKELAASMDGLEGGETQIYFC